MPAVVPWTPAAPPAFVQPALAPECRAANLRVDHAPVFSNGLAGSGYAGIVRIRNGGPPCSILGKPTLRFLGGPSAHMKQTQGALTPDLAPAASTLPPPFSLRSIPTGRTVWLAVAWRSWCAGTAPTTLEVALPSGGAVRLFPGGTPACHGARSTSLIQTDAFMPYVPPPKRSTAIPLKATLDKSSYTAVRGTTLAYRVTLENTSGDAYRFARCPVYVEMLGTPENILAQRRIAKELHYLNCRGVVIRAYSSVTFAMKLRVPKTLRAGHLLEWQLAPDSYSAPFAPAGVVLK